MIKVVIDRANRLVPLACKEVEDENDYKDEDEFKTSEFGLNALRLCRWACAASAYGIRGSPGAG